MNLTARLPSGVRWSGQLIATILLCLVALYFVVRDGLPVVLAAVQPSADPAAVDTTTPLLAKYNAAHDTNRRRIEGRAMFFAPPDWKRKAPPPPPPPPPQPTPPPPPPPETYSGKKPIGILGSTVFFEGGTTIDLGKESDGIKVVEIMTSWKVKLHHLKKDYEVTLGTKPDENLFKPASARSTSVPGIITGSASGTGAGTAAGTAPGASSGAAGAPAGAATAGAPAGAAAPGASRAAPAAAAAGATAVPPALTEDGVKKMTVEEAQAAMTRIRAALESADLDEDTRARLSNEVEWLSVRMRNQ